MHLLFTKMDLTGSFQIDALGKVKSREFTGAANCTVQVGHRACSDLVVHVDSHVVGRYGSSNKTPHDLCELRVGLPSSLFFAFTLFSQYWFLRTGSVVVSWLVVCEVASLPFLW